MAIKSDPTVPLNPFANRAAEKQGATKAKAKPAKAKPLPTPSRAPAIEPKPAPAAPVVSAEAPLRILSPGQISAARSLMGLSQTQFGELAGLSRATMSRIEEPKPGGPKPTEKALRAIVQTIEANGVIVLDEDESAGVGVRLKKGVPVAALKPGKAKR